MARGEKFGITHMQIRVAGGLRQRRALDPPALPDHHRRRTLPRSLM